MNKIFISAAFLVLASAYNANAKKIAAVGDSITEGFCSSDENKYAWPVQLGNMLTNGDSESEYEVTNFGVGGRTMLKKGDWPYWNEKAYQMSLEYEPDIVVIMFGTNDSKANNWNQEDFIADYKDMIASYQALGSSPDIYIMIPPPLYQTDVYGMSSHVVNEVFPILIPQIAEQAGFDTSKNVNVIDVFNYMGGKDLTQWELFCDDQRCDACHPNDAGYAFLGAKIYGKLFGKPLPQKGDNWAETVTDELFYRYSDELSIGRSLR